MADINSMTAALQSIQTLTQTRNTISTQAIKQAAQVEQVLADMLANSAKAGAAAEKGGINIFV